MPGHAPISSRFLAVPSSPSCELGNRHSRAPQPDQRAFQDISVRAQGTTIFEEVMTATGTLVRGTDLPEWVRESNHALLDDRLRFWLDSGSSFWLCRPDFLRATWWPTNTEADTGRTLMVVLRGCELVIQEHPAHAARRTEDVSEV